MIQDHYGHLSAAHLAALAAEMKLALRRGVRGRDVLCALRCGEGGSSTRPRRSPFGCAISLFLRAWRAASVCSTALPAKLGTAVRVMRAPCMGACDHAPVCAVGHVQVPHADGRQGCGRPRSGQRMRMQLSGGPQPRGLPPGWKRATRCSAGGSAARARAMTSSERCQIKRACAASAALAFRPAASGNSCARSKRPD